MLYPRTMIRLSGFLAACFFCPSWGSNSLLEPALSTPPHRSSNQAPISPGAADHASDLQGVETLEDSLRKRLGASTPALFAAVVHGDQPPLIAAVGVRASDQETRVTPQDKVHIGSCTKAMTATLAGQFVDEGSLNWDSTLSEVLPELASRIHSSYEDVTLKHLLTHRSGMPANARNWWLNVENDDIRSVRFDIAVDSLTSKPKHAAGAKYLYSNLGYMVAGMMLEKKADRPWEQIIEEKLFKPLGMTSTGFGPPGERDSLTQPRGHQSQQGNAVPMFHDNAPALGPAGRVHLSLADWLTFAQLHTQLHAKGTPNLISKTRLKQLHQAPNGKGIRYAAGWLVDQRGDVLTHSGSNTFWYATIAIDKRNNRIVLAAANSADKSSQKATREIVQQWMSDAGESR